jgi:transcriptional regulator with XRE-family HTH domain
MSLRKDKYMWLERIKEAKEAQGITPKDMADRMRLPKETITRILSGKTKNPYITTVLEMGEAVGLSPWEVFSETGLVLGKSNLKELQAELDDTKAQLELVRIACDVKESENAALIAEINLLKKELQHKEELLAVHNYYIRHGKIE